MGECANRLDNRIDSYNSESTDAERAPYMVSHVTQNLTISHREAAKDAELAKQKLLGWRKLSLVVDLDQTIIHAAVEPTIGEWQRDPDNPNFGVLQNVRAFQLADDGPNMRNNFYYVKMRPGLPEFLEHVSKLYELHIYTMGTRQYAMQVAKIVDPEGKYFGDRILSRDESGSLAVKSLQRLFPVDTRMVVIIDDRGDVWKWSENLIRVTPFEFFTGIGDINSSFLPKKQVDRPPPAVFTADAKPETKATDGASRDENGTTPPGGAVQTADTSALEQLVAMSGGDDPVMRELQANKQEEVIAAQVVEKPLLQLQKKLDEEEDAASAVEEAVSSQSSPSSDESQSGGKEGPEATTTDDNGDKNGHVPDAPDESQLTDDTTATKSTTQHHRHAVLHDSDTELVYLEAALSNVHTAFYKEYDRRRLSNKGGRVSTLAGKRKIPLNASENLSNDLMFVPDIKSVMPGMKKKVLAGVHIVFSGVHPLGQNIFAQDLTIWAESFGAEIDLDVRKKTTHVVARRTGTAKVKQALKKKNVKVVKEAWLWRCFSEWRKVDETPYLLEPRQQQDSGKSKTDEDDFLKGWLSTSEDDSESNTTQNGDNDTDSERPGKKLKLDTDIPTDDDEIVGDIDGDDADSKPDHSPLTLDNEERDEIDQELKDFLGSDADTDSEAESVVSVRGGPPLNSKKRKREIKVGENSNDTDDGPGLENSSKNDSNSLGPDDPSDPFQDASVTSRSGVRNAIRTAAATASDFNTVPATVLTGSVPDNEETRLEQEGIENEELAQEDQEEDSDDEMARELERELEGDDDSDYDGEVKTAAGSLGVKGDSVGEGRKINDIEEDGAGQDRQIEGWGQDLDTKPEKG